MGSSGTTPPGKKHQTDKEKQGNGGKNSTGGSSGSAAAMEQEQHPQGDKKGDSENGEKKDNLFGPGGTAADASTGRQGRRRAPAEALQGDKQLMKLLVKMNLRLAQEVRTINSAIYEVYLIKAESVELQRMNVEMARYNEATRGKPGHKLGPPHIWGFGALLEAIESRGTEVGAQTAKVVSEVYKEYGQLDDDEKLEWVKVCRVEKVFAKDLRRLLLAYGPDMKNHKEIAKALVQTGAVRKQGRAPEGGMEIALQHWLETSK